MRLQSDLYELTPAVCSCTPKMIATIISKKNNFFICATRKFLKLNLYKHTPTTALEEQPTNLVPEKFNFHLVMHLFCETLDRVQLLLVVLTKL